MPSSMQAQTPETANPAFAAAHAHFDAIVEQLGSGPLVAASHAEVEDVLHRDGLELMRLLFQDHLSLRAAAEPVCQVRGADQHPRPERRRMTRQLMTRFGPVTVSRLSYGAEGLASLRPLDAELNLPAEHASLGVRRLAAETAAITSFDETCSQLRRTTAATTGKRQLEDLVARAARDFDAFYAERSALAVREVNRTSSILVLTTDAKGVVMRPQGLRDATRRQAERAERKLRTRLSSGEKANRKRMAQVASVYTVAPYVRTPEQIVCGAGSLDQARAERPRPEAKRVWASLEDAAREVVAAMFDEAERRDPKRCKHWVVLVDGNDSQMEVVREEARRRGVGITIVLDVVHVLEYVWRAAWCFFEKGEAAAEAWVGERLIEILRGRGRHVAAGIRRSATLRGLPRAERERVDDCADYLLKYAKHCRYDEYLAAGLPIATGEIEGACRHLVSDRLDITGARWSLDGAEAVLKLRSLRSSGDFEQYWAFHQRQELERNHLSGYAGGTVPPALPATTSTIRSAGLRLVSPSRAE